jgi:hypothetical protein
MLYLIPRKFLRKPMVFSELQVGNYFIEFPTKGTRHSQRFVFKKINTEPTNNTKRLADKDIVTFSKNDPIIGVTF